MRAVRFLENDGALSKIRDVWEYSATSQLQRYTQIPFSDPGGGFYAISDYKQGLEWFVDRRANACSLYGPDQFYVSAVVSCASERQSRLKRRRALLRLRALLFRR